MKRAGLMMSILVAVFTFTSTAMVGTILLSF